MSNLCSTSERASAVDSAVQPSSSTNEEHDDSTFGKLIASEDKIDWNKSPWFLYGYYEYLPNSLSRCNICAKLAASEGKKIEPANDNQKQPHGIIRRPGSSTSMLKHHFFSYHSQYAEEFERHRVYVALKKGQVQSVKRRAQQVTDEIKTKQLKLVPNKGNDMALDIKPDKEFQKTWDSALTEFVSETQVPISLVGSEAFKKLIGLLLKKGRYSRLPQFKLKSRSQITRDLNKHAATLREELVQVLSYFKADMESISFTTDIWSSRNNESFMSLTVHFLTKDMNLVKLVPFVQNLTERHSGRNIRLAVELMLKRLGLDTVNITKYVETDNASNARVAFRSHPSLLALYCLNHTLQLMVNDSFKSSILGSEVKKIVTNCQKIAVKVKKSPLLTQELKTACIETGVRYCSLKKSQATRWHSTLRNIQSLLKLQPALAYLFADVSNKDWKKALSKFSLSALDWKIMKGISTCLEKVMVTSKSFEADLTSTSNLVVRNLFELQVFLDTFKNSSDTDRYEFSFFHSKNSRINYF